MRVMRPLRLISRNEELKISINALILSIPKMLNLIIVCFIFFLLFGIFGVNFFKGGFFHCVSPDIPIMGLMYACKEDGEKGICIDTK